MSKITIEEPKAKSEFDQIEPLVEGTSQESVTRSLRSCYAMGIKALDLAVWEGTEGLMDTVSLGRWRVD